MDRAHRRMNNQKKDSQCGTTTLTDKPKAPSDTRDEKTYAIVQAARATFLAKGFDSASMDAIALNANVSKRTVYNRFRSKEELFAAAIVETCSHLLPVNVEEIENTLPPLDFLRALSEQFLRGLLAPEAVALRRIAAFEAQRTPALGMAYLAHGPEMMAKTCVSILERTTSRANIKIEDPKLAIWHLGALITEPLYTHMLMGDNPENLDIAIERQLETGLSAFVKLYGLESLTTK